MAEPLWRALPVSGKAERVHALLGSSTPVPGELPQTKEEEDVYTQRLDENVHSSFILTNPHAEAQVPLGGEWITSPGVSCDGVGYRKEQSPPLTHDRMSPTSCVGRPPFHFHDPRGHTGRIIVRKIRMLVPLGGQGLVGTPRGF